MITPPEMSLLIGDKEYPNYVFTPSEIYNVEIFTSADVISDILEIDELTANVFITDDPAKPWALVEYAELETDSSELLTTDSDQSLLVTVPWSQVENKILLDSAFESLTTSDNEVLLCETATYPAAGTEIWVRFGTNELKFYLTKIQRVGKYDAKITAQSAIGVLDGKPDHMGGLYSGESFVSICADILGGAASQKSNGDYSITGGYVDATLSQAVAELPVYGHLPVASRRENLHALCFAFGVLVKRDANSNMFFTFPSYGTLTEISDSEIYDGDSLLEEDPQGVVITEHSFLKTESTEAVVLFDNMNGSGTVDHQRVIFDNAPYYDLQATAGLTINEFGVNYAVLSGVGVLTGKPYIHIRMEKALWEGAVEPGKVLKPLDNGLISALNSPMILQRLLAYTAGGRTLQSEIVLDTLTPGDAVVMTNAFGDLEIAFLQSMRIIPSAVNKASCEFIANFDASHIGNAYDSMDLLTGYGNWTVPDGVYKIFVRIVSGGNGGASGTDGTDAYYDRTEDKWVDGLGGTGGDSGAGGRIRTITLEVLPGDTMAYACGYGGTGGQRQEDGAANVPGMPGGDSTFGGYTTGIDAASSVYGIADLLDRTIVRATPGVSGVAGADAGDPATTITFNGITYQNGANGTHTGTVRKDSTGGGAAVGSDGYPGEVKTGEISGKGGNGGNAIAGVNASVLGGGGAGGHGGGGGGSGATDEDGWPKEPGTGGLGSNGGNGGSGFIEVYYKAV